MNATLKCASCGATYEPPAADHAAGFAAEEAARCARLGDLREQRRTLEAARTQAGFAGVVDVDTVDLVVQRESLSRLDAALRSEHDEIERAMKHTRYEVTGTR